MDHPNYKSWLRHCLGGKRRGAERRVDRNVSLPSDEDETDEEE